MEVLRLTSNRNLAMAIAGVALGILGVSVSMFSIAYTYAIRSEIVWSVLGVFLALMGFLLALFSALNIKE